MRTAPSRSALFTTKTSAISSRPAFITCTVSPASGHEDHDDRVGEPHDVELGLPDADRLDEHDVHAEGVEQPDDVARRARQAAVAAARGEAADEDARVEEVRLHADAVAEHGAARERARRVDRDDADPPAAGAQARR